MNSNNSHFITRFGAIDIHPITYDTTLWDLLSLFVMSTFTPVIVCWADYVLSGMFSPLAAL